MDPRDNGSLIALEQLMEEFFNPLTNNSRKQEIEQQLNYFKSLQHLWKYCIHFLSNTSNQYVKMFALSSLETVINQQWTNIEWSAKEEIKNLLQNYLVEQGPMSPHFFRFKYSKLIIDIAKHDWPVRYPNFFNNILELLRNEPNQLIGLTLLKTTSEEFMGIQATYKNNIRKDEITRLLHQYIPVVFELLTNILDNLGTKPRHTSTATPPPSPAHPSSSPTLSQSLVTASFRPDPKILTKEALETVQHLFTWAPVQRIPSQIIKAIFTFTNVSSYSQDDDDMCVLAMSTINELLYRKCTPPNTQDFYFQLYHQTVDLLKEITSSPNRIDSLDPVFMDKMSELLILLIEHHFWRLEAIPDFSALELLSPLFQLTLQLVSVKSYLCCLNVWASFTKQIKTQSAKKYSDVFLTLVTTLLKKIQFTYNFNQLNLLDDNQLDENNETEWQTFLKTTIEVVAVIAEYTPTETFGLVLSSWKVSYDIFRSLEQSLDYQNPSLKLDISETERLCYVFKDFSSLTQALTRLSSIYVDLCESPIPVLNSIVEKLLECASLFNETKMYDFIVREGDTRLNSSFIELHSQLLYGIKTLLPWTTQKNSINNYIMKAILDITLPVLRNQNTLVSKIKLSAAHLLLRFTDIVHAPLLLAVPSVVQFIQIAPNLTFCDKQSSCVINSSIANLLLKPWGELSQEDSLRRNSMINAFFENLTKDFRNLDCQLDFRSCREERTLQVVENTLPSLSVIVERCKHYPIASKKLLAAILKPTIQHGLYLFPVFSSKYMYKEACDHLLTFFLNVMGVIQQQLGVEETKNAVGVFMQVTMNERQNYSLCGLDKLLQILQLIIEAPGNGYKTFLPSVLQLSMENIYPVVVLQGRDTPEVFVALLSLLYSILLHRWQYFYVSQVKLGYSPGCSDSDQGIEHPQKPEQLLAVLQVFGQALLQEDLNVFHLSLAALEELNSKWKLYHKMLFRQHLLCEFLTVLLNCLLDKSQNSLSDDIQLAVYNMAAVNFEDFYTTFLRKFVCCMVGVTDEQRNALLTNFHHNCDTDMPTFVHNLQSFVNESRQYRLCNISYSMNGC